ncbi:MAG: hypothetical protein KBS98_07300 [Flavobacterium sp.]|nr:hypothetical protein [Candidatus Neoflavobacterium equi]
MGFFDLFKNKTTQPELYTENNLLYYRDYNEYEGIDLDQLQYIYALKLGDLTYLMLFDHRQHYIKIDQTGFSTVFDLLLQKFPFDIALFKRVKSNPEETKERLWMLQHTQNYRLSTASPLGIAAGYDVLQQPLQHLSWDVTYQELTTLGVGHLYQNQDGISYFKFDYPVKIGPLVLNQLEVYYDVSRADIGIQGYFSDLYDESNSELSFDELKNVLSIYTTEPVSGYEREDQRNLTFDFGNISLNIIYTYAAGHGYDNGSTTLFINNNSDYSHIILPVEDAADGKELQWVELPDELDFVPNYKKTMHLLKKPLSLAESPTNCVWLDVENKRFGCTTVDLTMVYSIREVQHILIQNVLPAKGGGYVEFIVIPKTGYQETIYYGNQDALDAVGVKIEKLLGIPVLYPEPYYNC